MLLSFFVKRTVSHSRDLNVKFHRHFNSSNRVCTILAFLSFRTNNIVIVVTNA